MLETNLENIIEMYREDETKYFYFYTPFCGICKKANKMLELTEEALKNNIEIKKVNLNLTPGLSRLFGIANVPCVIITKSGNVMEKIYSFDSVTELYNRLHNKLF
jgi:thiol-disulfide isomerase/thioredoxin